MTIDKKNDDSATAREAQDMTTRETLSLEALEQRLLALTPEAILEKMISAGEGVDKSALFDAMTKERGEVMSKLIVQRRAVSAGRLNIVKVELRDNISAAILASGIEELLGEIVTRLIWQADESKMDDKGEDIGIRHPMVLINAKRVSVGAASSTGVGRGRRSKVRLEVGGTSYEPRPFNARFANSQEKEDVYYEKWPTKLAEKIAVRLRTEGTPVTMSEI